MTDQKKEILIFLRAYGPILPAQVAKKINTNILFASAILSDLVSRKEVKITKVKTGSSPFYYLQGQETKLQELSKHLHPKEKEAYELLKKELVIRDKTAETWQKVALREIKDYANPINVKIKDQVELFWKWYLTPKEDLKTLIEKKIAPPKQETLTPVTKEEPIKEEIIKPKKQEPLKEKPKKTSSDFKQQVTDYINNKNIKNIETKLEKARELNFLVQIPSNIGSLTYFLKAKNKKSINESDLIIALNQSNSLPVLFITPGKLTKKAEAFLIKNSSIIFKKL